MRTRNKGSPRATKSPTCGTNSITTSATLGDRHQVGLIKRQHDARSPQVLDDGSLTLGGRRPARLLFGRIKSLGIDALHNSTSFVRDALEHGNRPQRSSHPLHKPEEDDNARQVAEDGKSDRQLRRRVFNSSRGCDGVRVGKGKDAEDPFEATIRKHQGDDPRRQLRTGQLYDNQERRHDEDDECQHRRRERSQDAACAVGREVEPTPARNTIEPAEKRRDYEDKADGQRRQEPERPMQGPFQSIPLQPSHLLRDLADFHRKHDPVQTAEEQFHSNQQAHHPHRAERKMAIDRQSDEESDRAVQERPSPLRKADRQGRKDAETPITMNDTET